MLRSSTFFFGQLFAMALIGLQWHAVAAEPVDWSQFHSSGKVKGVVEKIDDSTLTISVPKLERGKSSAYRGGRNRRPSVKVGHEDIEISFADGALVRWEKLPKTTGGTERSAKELEEAKKPTGTPGYAALKDDLKPGHIVELHLVHPGSIPDKKLTVKDIAIKYAVIEGETAPPPHADGKDPKKTKEK